MEQIERNQKKTDDNVGFSFKGKSFNKNVKVLRIDEFLLAILRPKFVFCDKSSLIAGSIERFEVLEWVFVKLGDKISN